MRLISKHYELSSKYEGFSQLLDNIPGSFQQVYVASAYTDATTMRKDIFNVVKEKQDGRGCRLLFFIDKAASKASRGQKNSRRYRLLNTHMQEQFSSHCDIKLVAGNLFHSKLIYVVTSQESHIFIGSMNMTQNGVIAEENEEIMLHISNPNKKLQQDITTYFTELQKKENSTSLTSEVQTKSEQKTLRNFFLDGNLYVRYTNQSLLSFKLDLPPKVLKDRETQIHPLIGTQNRGHSISLISLHSSISKEASEVLENDYAQTEQNVDFDEIAEKWSPYCLETSLGFWAPKSTCPIIDSILSQKEESKIERLNAILESLKEGKLDNVFKKVLSEISITLNLDDSWQKRTYTRWITWSKRLVTKLEDINSNETQKFKILHGVYKTSLFDIFNDKEYSDEFYEYIIDFIESSLLKPRIYNKIVQKIRESMSELKLEDITNLDEIFLSPCFLKALDEIN